MDELFPRELKSRIRPTAQRESFYFYFYEVKHSDIVPPDIHILA